MSSAGHVEEPKNFTPKNPVKLEPPKSDPITIEELSKCNGTLPASRVCWLRFSFEDVLEADQLLMGREGRFEANFSSNQRHCL